MFCVATGTRLVDVETGRYVQDHKQSNKLEMNDTMVKDYTADESCQKHNECRFKSLYLSRHKGAILLLTQNSATCF